MKLQILSLLLVFTAMLSCSNPDTTKFGNFDFKAFRSDRGACENKREKLQTQLKSLRQQILGLSENEVIDLFGRYDFQILDTKNQKVFIYYLEKGPHCEFIQNESSALSIAMYFNATSLVKDITFQSGKP